jgi:hypothetical protein
MAPSLEDPVFLAKEEVKTVRFVQLILGLLVIIFVLFTLGNYWPWGRVVLLILGILLVILSFMKTGQRQMAPPPEPMPPPKPAPEPKPEEKPKPE